MEESLGGWVRRNGCVPEPTVTLEEGNTVCSAWSGCAEGGAVEHCRVEGFGHWWPGTPRDGGFSGAIDADVDATTVIWDFFAAHSLPS